MVRTAAYIAFTLLFCGLVVRSTATDDATRQAQLKLLRTRISQLQSRLDSDVRLRSKLQVQLRTSEQQIAHLAGSLRALSQTISRAQSRLDDLRREQSDKQQLLSAQKQALARQMRSAYMEGQDSQLQLLLNAQDPATISRLLAFYDYFNKARAARIQAVRAQLDALARINTQIQQQLTKLTNLQAERTQALADLQHSRAARKLTLSQLNATIRSRNQKLARMRDNARTIEQLLSNLQQTLADIPADLEGQHRFASLRGRMPWPVSGRLIQRFGEPLSGGRLRARGDLIAAPLGTPVHAVSYGRVVFADWLPHFGLLVIIDHGGGYMSIYAHNQSIYAHVGDWVHMGETIATLGDSGGQNQAALYFEIRDRKQAVNPQDWCHGRLPRS
ncbi:MAG: peptidoglycan DD-metalloendopeptidase family protein [Gammaproteobacteria bacterium]|nr:peptidoglycan DD-metalloendopeptidase family protein [Gammaproteobacteria bacterium]